jgi:hypothetical protein
MPESGLNFLISDLPLGFTVSDAVTALPPLADTVEAGRAVV